VSGTPEVSVVLPVYRNQATLEELHGRLVTTLEAYGRPFEILFVNDACPDGSLDVLRALADRDPRVRVVALDLRAGQHAALRTGLAHSRGRVVVTMDADLQDPPEAIPALLAALDSGYGAVYAGRRGRYESRWRLATSWVFKHALSLVAGMPADAGAFIAMRRVVADRVVTLPGRAPFITAAVAFAGRPVSSIPVVRASRSDGQSSYTAGMRFRTAATALTQAIGWRLSGVAR
jgi:polyisoprenyl-phosphate glycosyltransferase